MSNQVREAEATATKNTNGELIFSDATKIGYVKRDMPKAENALNDFYKSTVSILGELSLEQIKELPTDGTQVIKKELESRYQFPHANSQFNLEALGINIEPAYAAYKNKSKWKPYKFKFKGGRFVLLPDEMQPEITKHHHYTDTPEKKQAVKLIRDLLKLTDKLKEAGLVGNGSDAYLFDFLNYNVLTREKGIGRTPIVLNRSGCVQMLREAGKKK